MGVSEKKYNDKENENIEDTENRISVLVRELRSYLKLSQAAFAEPLGLSPTHIARFEKGISKPSPETINAICDAFSVDRRYFEPGELEGRDPVISLEQAVEKRDQAEGIAGRVKSAREEKGWSQNELAKRSGVNQATINRVEAGAKLTEKQAVKIAEVLEVGIEWLIKGDEGKKRYPVDRKMIDWLWTHEEDRIEVWNRMKRTYNEE